MEGAAKAWNTVAPVMTTQDAILSQINRYYKNKFQIWEHIQKDALFNGASLSARLADATSIFPKPASHLDSDNLVHLSTAS